MYVYVYIYIYIIYTSASDCFVSVHAVLRYAGHDADNRWIGMPPGTRYFLSSKHDARIGE